MSPFSLGTAGTLGTTRLSVCSEWISLFPVACDVPFPVAQRWEQTAGDHSQHSRSWGGLYGQGFPQMQYLITYVYCQCLFDNF